MSRLTTILKSAAGNLAVLLVSLGIALLVAEMAFRAINSDEIFMMPRYVTDADYAGYQIRRNVPNAEYTHTTPDGSWAYFINSRGLRDTREFAYDKPDGVLRILTLGDSFTLGFEVGQEQTYAAVLERDLERHGINAEVINAGVSGFSNAEALVYLREEGLRYQPDVVVLGFFVNDLSDNVRADLFRLDQGELIENKKTYLPAIRLRNLFNSFWLYRWLSENSSIHNYLNARATVYVRDYLAAKNLDVVKQDSEQQTQAPDADYPTALTRSLIKAIYNSASGAGARFILMNIPSPELESAIPIDAADAADYSTQYLDMHGILSGYAGLIDLYRPHGFEHWTEFAHVLAGRALSDVVREHPAE